VKSYDLRERFITSSGRVTPWVPVWSRTNTWRTAADVTLPQRRTLCLSVRARDNVGNLSRWSSPRCQTALTDDRYLSASSGWFRGVATGDFDQTFTGTRRHGAVLHLRNVDVRHVAVAAVVCPTCGAISVRVGNRQQRLSLRSTLTGTRLFELAVSPSSTRRTIVITVVSHNQLVQVDGVGVDPR
jgi:hypothetical protein